jgi:hypothetical protein
VTRSAAEITSELVGSGLTAQQLALVLELTVALSTGNSTGLSTRQNADMTAERRRAWDRDRKAAKRNSTGIPPDFPPDTKPALSFKEKEKSNQDLKKERAPRKRGSGIPPDWKPTPAHLDEGRKLGINEPQVMGLAEDMRLWAGANEHREVARKSNWNLTFSAWMRRHATGAPNGNGTGQNRSHQPRQAAGDALIAGMAAALSERPDSRLYRGDAGGRDCGSAAGADDRQESLALTGDARGDREPDF